MAFFSSIPAESTILLALYIGLLVATIGVAYYASAIFLHMRNGKLEKGWRLVAEGVVCLSGAFVFLTLQHAVERSSDLYFYLDAAGTVLAIAAIILIFFGLRSHYLVWTRK